MDFNQATVYWLRFDFKNTFPHAVKLTLPANAARSDFYARDTTAQQAVLEQQVEERTAELQQSLNDLRQTQNQLIQSEKMASLGELTAGIAHEIQNPLNFVINFSEVSVELMTELKEEVKADRPHEVIDIADDLTQNLEKIYLHGKRADEHLRLAYHGLRAKNNDFNAELVTDFADDLPLVHIVPQDIGRVLLNILNNAFYAVQERKKKAGPDYRPRVAVNTLAFADEVQVIINDNGIGIPETIKNKILQPFFTTKPTGEGTGLGLSLSYDILVKAHGGRMMINSEEGKGTEIILSLPV